MSTIMALILLFIFSTIDYVQTIYAVRSDPWIVEMNPIMQVLLENNCVWILKLVIVPVMIVLAYWALKKLNIGSWFIWIFTTFYALIVLHGFHVILASGLI